MIRIFIQVYFCVFALFVFTVTSSMATADKITMVTGAKAPYAQPDNAGFLDRIALEAFKRVGLEVEVKALPAARALEEASHGRADGDMQRIKGLEKRRPNLIPVEESISQYDFIGFTKNKSLTNITFEDLPKHKVAYLLGWKFYDINVPKETQVQQLNSPQQLMEFLKKDRTDIVLFSRWSGYYWANKVGVKVHSLNSPFRSMDMYMYLNKKHIELAPKLAAALRSMKEDGTYNRIKIETLENWKNSGS